MVRIGDDNARIISRLAILLLNEGSALPRRKGAFLGKPLCRSDQARAHDAPISGTEPNGVVPTLDHDGVPIYESTLINEYLDEVFQDVRLMPADPVERARARF
jgi:hypothetical protein